MNERRGGRRVEGQLLRVDNFTAHSNVVLKKKNSPNCCQIIVRTIKILCCYHIAKVVIKTEQSSEIS